MKYYDMEGQEITQTEWVRLFEDASARTVARDERDGITVSTVLLGIDHSWSDEGPPIIFETMIFGGDHNEFQDRYATREEAKEGHQRAYALAFGGQPGV